MTETKSKSEYYEKVLSCWEQGVHDKAVQRAEQMIVQSSYILNDERIKDVYEYFRIYMCVYEFARATLRSDIYEEEQELLMAGHVCDSESCSPVCIQEYLDPNTTDKQIWSLSADIFVCEYNRVHICTAEKCGRQVYDAGTNYSKEDICQVSRRGYQNMQHSLDMDHHRKFFSSLGYARYFARDKDADPEDYHEHQTELLNNDSSHTGFAPNGDKDENDQDEQVAEYEDTLNNPLFEMLPADLMDEQVEETSDPINFESHLESLLEEEQSSVDFCNWIDKRIGKEDCVKREEEEGDSIEQDWTEQNQAQDKQPANTVPEYEGFERNDFHTFKLLRSLAASFLWIEASITRQKELARQTELASRNRVFSGMFQVNGINDKIDEQVLEDAARNAIKVGRINLPGSTRKTARAEKKKTTTTITSEPRGVIKSVKQDHHKRSKKKKHDRKQASGINQPSATISTTSQPKSFLERVLERRKKFEAIRATLWSVPLFKDTIAPTKLAKEEEEHGREEHGIIHKDKSGTPLACLSQMLTKKSRLESIREMQSMYSGPSSAPPVQHNNKTPCYNPVFSRININTPEFIVNYYDTHKGYFSTQISKTRANAIAEADPNHKSANHSHTAATTNLHLTESIIYPLASLFKSKDKTVESMEQFSFLAREPYRSIIEMETGCETLPNEDSPFFCEYKKAHLDSNREYRVFFYAAFRIVKSLCPGKHRLEMEIDDMIDIVNDKSRALKYYLAECSSQNIIPNMHECKKMSYFDPENYKMVLGSHMTDEEVVKIVRVMYGLWKMCESSPHFLHNPHRLLIANHCVSILYMMQHGYSIGHYQVVPRVAKFGQGYLLPPNEINKYGYSRTNLSIGTEFFKKCLQSYYRTRPIQQTLFYC